MDWTQWGKGEERAQSSAGCEILEAPLIGRLRASVNVSWHNGAGSGLENSPVISLLFGSACVLILLLLVSPKKWKLCCPPCGHLHGNTVSASIAHGGVFSICDRGILRLYLTFVIYMNSSLTSY